MKKWLIVIIIFCIIPFTYSLTLTDELISWYEFDGDSVDYYGIQNGTDTDINYDSGVIGNCANFTGANSEIDFNNFNGWKNTDNHTTICFAVYDIKISGGDFDTIWGTQHDADQFLHLKYVDNVAYIHFRYIGQHHYMSVDSFSIPLKDWSYNCIVSNTTSWAYYVNGTQHSLTAAIGSNTGYWVGSYGDTSVGSNYYMGDREVDQDMQFNGCIDELGYWNRTLNTSEISSLYTQVFTAGTRPYEIADSLLPNITLFYPNASTHHNNFNDSIIVNVTDNIMVDNCTINNSNWIFQGNDSSYFRWDYSGVINGNYSLLVNCSDTSSNWRNLSFWFVYDSVNPIINIFSPLNNSYYNTDILFNVSFFDNYLYRTRIYINRTDNDIDSIQLHSGTLDSGTIDSLQTLDSNIYNISENGGIVLFFNYTDIVNFSGVGLYYLYEGNPAHNIYLSFYNYDTEDWDNIIQLNEGTEEWLNYSFTAVGLDGYIYVNNNTGLVQGRINHTSAPNVNHWLWIDEIFINGTERYHYYNYSGTLFTDFYNVSEFWNISEENDGEYNIIFEATDTHTTDIFNDGYNTEEGYTNNYQNYYKKYYMDYGEIEFITPVEIEIIDWRETDRIKQQFYSLLETDLEEVEIEIEADSIEYFSTSNYNCHLILNKKYWYDCEGLNNAEIVSISSQKAKFKFFHTLENDISESLGGLNYINTSYNITLDRTNPILNNYTVTNSTTTIQWELFFSENNTYNYSIGLNCSDNSIDTGLGNNTDLTVTNNLLSSGITYYMNITLIDFASNSNNYCINGTTISTAIDYTIISAIVNQSIADALEEEGRRMNEGLIIVIIFIIWAFILVASYLTRTSAGIMFASIWGIFTSLWLWNTTDFPKFVVVTFSAVCIWLIYIMWGEDFN